MEPLLSLCLVGSTRQFSAGDELVCEYQVDAVDAADELHVIAFVRDVEVDEHAAHVAVNAPAGVAQPARRRARRRMRALVLDLIRLPGQIERQPRHHPSTNHIRAECREIHR